jgi:signal peptidase I
MSALTDNDQKKTRLSKIRKKDVIIGVLIIGIALFGTFGVFAIMKASLKTDIPLVVVTSESMVPTINVGDLLVVKGMKYVNGSDIKNGTVEDKQGDIIIYDANGLWNGKYPLPEGNQPIVHRIVGKWWNETAKEYYFYTKGDNNDKIDPPGGLENIPVPAHHILGVVKNIIPKLGYMKIWLTESNLGVPLIIIIGGLLVISIIYDVMHPEDEEEEKKKSEKKKALKDLEIEKAVKSSDSTSKSDASSTKKDSKNIDLGL